VIDIEEGLAEPTCVPCLTVDEHADRRRREFRNFHVSLAQSLGASLSDAELDELVERDVQLLGR
jgi:hypothetical protein